MKAQFILGTKGISRQTFTESGVRIPVTEITVSPCHLVGIRSMDTDGYWAVQLGFGTTKNGKKSQEGLLKKAGIKTPLNFFREVRLDNLMKTGMEVSLIEKDKKKGIKIGETEMFVGDAVQPATMFAKDDLIQVTGVSKGKGFQGVVRRHGFHGGPRTHGQSDRERAPGSIGQGTTPGRVYKGKRMAGRMGSETATIKNLRIVEAGEQKLVIQGLVPGAKGTLLTISFVN